MAFLALLELRKAGEIHDRSRRPSSRSRYGAVELFFFSPADRQPRRPARAGGRGAPGRSVQRAFRGRARGRRRRRAERVETAIGLLAGGTRDGRSGIVLEQVAGGYAFRAAREAAEACARLVERPVQRGSPRRRSRRWPWWRTSARCRVRDRADPRCRRRLGRRRARRAGPDRGRAGRGRAARSVTRRRRSSSGSSASRVAGASAARRPRRRRGRAPRAARVGCRAARRLIAALELDVPRRNLDATV